MNITFDFCHFGETSPLSPEISGEVELIMAAGSAPIEELHKSYGGTLPEEVTVIFMRGPVGRRVQWKDGRLNVKEQVGVTLVQGGGVFVVVLELGPVLRTTALHEYMHVLGHLKEGFVKQAVRDFIQYHRWVAGV